MKKLAININTLIGIILTTLVSSVYADDIEVTAPIDAVTVFVSGAEVTRRGEVTIPAGGHRLIISDLPPRIDPARLQVSLDNANVRLGNLQLKEVYAAELSGEEELRLQSELEALFYDRQEITDTIESANTQLKFLDSLASGSVGGKQAVLAGSELVELLGSLAALSNEARLVIRDANQLLKNLDRDVEQKRLELSQVETRRRSQQILTVSVDAESATTAVVSISYPVVQARWNWLYEARLDTQTRTLELQRKVSVSQTTGENWANVQLDITTARPNENTRTPKLDSLLVDFISDRPAPAPMQSTAFRLEQRLKVDADTAIEEAVVGGSYIRSTVDVEASQYLVNFNIPGRVSIAADSQPQLLPIDQRGLPVNLVTRAVPERDTNAYLEARFTLDDSVPLQAGLMQLYRDGAFIGRQMVAQFLPGEEVSLAFGKDERVRVEIRAQPEASRGGSTFRRNAVEDHRTHYQLTSFHADPIELEILARIPISQNSAIDVEISKDATPFDEENVGGNTGVVLWKRQLQSSEVVEIRHYYAITYPQDNQLWFRDN